MLSLYPPHLAPASKKGFQRIRSATASALFVAALFVALPASQLRAEDCEVVVKEAPQLHEGRIKGDLRVMTGESFNITTGVTIDGSLIVPGTPQFNFGGGYQPPAIVQGTGAAQPDDYTITINNDPSIGGITTRTDGEALPEAIAPQATNGTRKVVLKKASDDPGDFATIQTLTLNSSKVAVTLPPGRYERISLNGGSTLTLQAGTEQNPALYEIERLDVNGSSRINVTGHVEVRLANSFNLTGHMGDSENPEWLKLSISGGSFTLNNASTFHGEALVPAGTLKLNGKSLVHGQVYASSLMLNGESIIECAGNGGPANLPPTAANVEATTAIDTAVDVTLLGTDPEGAPITYAVATNPSNGTVTLNGDVATYTPNASFVGQDTFTFTVSDGTLTSASATVTIHVFQPNRAPTANSATVSINQGESDAPILLSATDPEGDAITYQIVTPPSEGTLAGTAPELTYTHTGDRSTQVVEDSFTFTATDSQGAVSAVATITIQLQPVNRAPSADALTLATNEDQALAVVLTGSDPDGDALSFEIVADPNDPQATAGPSSGTITGEAPNLTYTPDANFNGADSFFYRASDGSLFSDPVEVTITVAPVNDAPVVQALAASGSEDTAIELELVGADVDGDVLQFSVTTPQDFPGTTVLVGSTLTFTPDQDFNGEATMTYTATDPSGATDTANITFTVLAVNDAPIADAASLNTSEDQALAIQLTGSDIDGDAITFEVTTAPTSGTLAGTAPNLTYTPNPNFNGADSFEFTVSDGTATSTAATVSIAVAPVNDAPVASNLVFAANEDQAVAIQLVAGDVDGDALAYSVVTPPSNGTLSGTAPNLTYTPAADFNGQDSFTFAASDGSLVSNAATVTINVAPINDLPTALAAQYEVAEDGSVAIVLTGDDVDGDSLTFNVTVAPTNGTLVGTAPNLTYTPGQDYNGADSFSFTASDAESTSAPAVITLNITPVNDAPVAADLAAITDEDQSVAIALTATDVDGDVLTYSVTTPPSNGVLSGTAPNLTYTPGLNFNGQDAFTFTASDGALVSNVATVTIEVAPQNDVPTALAAQYSLAEDGSISITLTSSDPDGDPQTYAVTVAPSNGSLTGTAPNLTYTPSQDYNGADSFQFTASDTESTSAAALISLTINPVNDAPVASDADYTTTEDQAIALQLGATDVDGDSLAYSVTTPPSNGTLSGNAPNYVYTPATNFNGQDSFAFQASDGSLLSNIATVTINVTAINDAPTALAATYTVDEDGSVAIVLTGNDPDGDALTFNVTAQPENGTLTGTAPNLTYTPSLNYNGPDSLSFTVSDAEFTSAPTLISIDVTPVDDAPEALAATISAFEDAATSITLQGSDVDGDPLTYTVTTAPQHGSITGTAPDLTYTPDADYNGEDSFAFVVNDGTSDSAPSIITISIAAVDDAPVADPANYVLQQHGSVSFTLTGTSVDGDELSFAIQTAPSNGTITGNSPNFTYTPDPSFNGIDSLEFVAISDRTGLTSAAAPVTFEVTANNLAPIAGDLDVTIDSFPVDIVLPATDPEGLPLTYSVGTQANSYVFITGTAPNLTLTRRSTLASQSAFTYTVTDSEGLTATGTVNITILAANRNPYISSPSTFTVAEDAWAPFNVVATDPDNDPLTYSISLPAGSPLTIEGAGPSYLASVVSNFTGPTTFTVTAEDGRGGSYTRSVTLNVTAINDAPMVDLGNTTVPEDGVLNLAISAVDPEGSPVTYELISGPENGTLAGTLPSLTYVPNPNFNGVDTFVFTVSDGTLTVPVTATINVTAVNDDPTAPRITDKLLGLTGDYALNGYDPDGDPLTYRIVTPPSVGTATISGNLLTVTTTEPYVGTIRFTYVANDGTVDSAPAEVVLSGSIAPEARILSPLAGARLPEGQAVTVLVDAHDADGTIVRYDLLVNGAQVATSTTPSIQWTPTQTGDYSLAVKVTDNTALTHTSAGVNITITGENEAPVVFAGSDRNAYAVGLESNLIQNGSCELPLNGDGSIPFWETIEGYEGMTQLDNSDTYFNQNLPVPADGEFFFSPDILGINVVDIKTTKIRQSIALDPADPVGTQYHFICKVYAHKYNKFTYADPNWTESRVLFEFLSADGEVVSSRLHAGKTPQDTWHPFFSLLERPEGATDLRITLISHREPEGFVHQTFFDDVVIAKASSQAAATLSGQVSDDGLPVTGSLTHQWVQVSGPAAQIDDPTALSTNVTFSSSGLHEFRLEATDGELSGSNTVLINVGLAADENAAPRIELPSQMTVFAGDAPHPLNAVVTDDGKPSGILYHSWQQIEGPADAAFTNKFAASTEFTVPIPGIYRFRLTSHDGAISASSEVLVDAQCHPVRQPIDLYICIDHSGSMFGPQPGVVTDDDSRTPIYNARRMVENLLSHLDPALDRVTINKNNASNWNYPNGNGTYATMPFTADFELAREKIIMPTGFHTPLTGVGASETILAISNAVPYVETNGRPEARKIILHLNDGIAGFIAEAGNGILRSDQIAEKGITTISISMPNMLNDPMDRYNISSYVTSPAHAFYVDSLSDPSVIQSFLNVAMSTLCRDFTDAPIVDAGDAVFLPSIASTFQPTALVEDDQPLSEISLLWEQVSGPSPAAISDASKLRPVIAFGQVGVYQFRLTANDGQGSASDSVTVVVGSPSSTPTPSGMIAYWPFDGSMQDIVESRVLSSKRQELLPEYSAEAKAGQSLDLTTRTHPFHQTEGPTFDLKGTETGMAVSFWCKTPTVSGVQKMVSFVGYGEGLDGTPYVAIDGLVLNYYATAQALSLSYQLSNNTTAPYSTPNGTMPQGQWNHVIVNYDPATFTVSIIINGKTVHQRVWNQNQQPIFARKGQILAIGPVPSSPIDWAKDPDPNRPMLQGMIDELAVFDRALTAEDIINLSSRTGGLLPPNVNPLPEVDAGLNQVVSLSDNNLQLEGFVTDDNNSPGVSWSLVSGPAAGVSITDPNSLATPISFSQAGIYRFQLDVDDGYHQVSDTVEFRVDQPCLVEVPAGAYLWYQANGDSKDTIAGRDGIWNGTPSYTDGQVSGAFRMTGNGVYVTNNDLDPADFSEIAFEGWIRDTSNGLTDQILMQIQTNGTAHGTGSLQLMSRANAGNGYLQLQIPYFNTTGGFVTTTTKSTFVSNVPTYPVGAYYHLAVSISLQSGISVYVNGDLKHQSTLPGDLVLPQNPQLRLGNAFGATFASIDVDEFTLYNAALDPADVLAIFQAGSAGKCPPWAETGTGTVDAGPSITLAAPGNHQFTGSYDAADFTGTPTVQWTQQEGPATVTLDDATILTPTGSYPVPGRYVFRLTVDDGTVTGSDLTIVDVLQPANTAPVITWTPPATLQLPNNTLVFDPTVTDDGLPNGEPTSSWRVVNGPANVLFSDLPGTANLHDVSAQFTSAGTYDLELYVNDGLLSTTATFTVTVLEEPEPPLPNTAPTVDLGADLLASATDVLLQPAVTDDGKPDGQVIYNWNYTQGPAAPAITSTGGSTNDVLVSFSIPGIYEIQLTVSDGELSTTDTVLIDVPASLFGPGDGLNAAPQLATIPGQVVAQPETTITLQPAFTDPDGPATAYTFAWEQVGGSSPIGFSSTTTHATTLSFTEVGQYLVKFTLTDGPYIRSIYIPINHVAAPNEAPVLAITPANGSTQPMTALSFSANATDDGPVENLSYQWDWLSAPNGGAPMFADANAAQTDITFPLSGQYLIVCQVSDGELSASQTVSVTVQGDPILAIITPQNGSTVSDQVANEAQIRAFRDGGSVTTISLSLDGVPIGSPQLEAGTVDYFLQLPDMQHGSHTLSATATYDDGSIETRSSTFTYSDYAEDALQLFIDSPYQDQGEVTAPTDIVGTVKSPLLDSYTIEIASVDTPDAKTVIATGSTQIESGTLGVLDPTLLENGVYTITLSATTSDGLFASVSEDVVIDGNMKFGQFSLAFEDMSIDLPGVPLTVTRTYDSRDMAGGDFGPGWSMATHSIKLRKTRPFDQEWEQNQVGGGFVTNLVFAVEPTRRKRVILTFPGGRTEMFDVGIRAGVPYSEDQPNLQKYTAIISGSYNFIPVGSTTGKLEVLGETELSWSGFSNDYLNGPVEGVFSSFEESVYNPSRFRYTEPGGASYIIDEDLGLLSITDTNGNIVTINDDGIHHSAGESLLFTRNAQNKITEITNTNGRKTRYEYYASGQLRYSYNALNHRTEYRYENAAFPHYLTTIRDPRGFNAIRTTYDAEGRMIAQTDANGNSIAFTHEVSNNRETIVDRLGNATVHEFDDYGNITRTTDPLGGVTLRSYDERDYETSTTTPLGFTTNRTFDEKGNLLDETDPLGNVTSYSYDSEQRPLTIVDALNNTTAIAYFASGNPSSMTDPTGTTTNFNFNSSGQMTAITDENGTSTTYTHDAKGREKSMRVVASNGAVLASEVYDYDEYGNRIQSIVFDGERYLTTKYTYDAENRLTSTIHPDGTITRTSYDVNGNVTGEVNALNFSTVHVYDSLGNLIRSTYPGGRVQQFGYDVKSRQTSSTDFAGNTTYTLYDALDRVVAVIEPDDSMPTSILTEVADIASAPELADNPRTLTAYNADGRVTSTTDANGNTTQYEYDDAGRRTAVIDPDGKRMTYVYDDAGRQTSVTDFNDNTTGFVYDDAGRLVRTNLPDGNFTTSAYDTLGRRISSTDAEGNTTQYAYDPQGRLIAVTDPDGKTTTYGYDMRGLQISQTDALGRTTRYEYDAMGRRIARVLPGGERETMEYNNVGSLTAHTDFNGQRITRTYNTQTQDLLSIVAPGNHPSLTLSHAPARFEFTYDALSRRTSSVSKDKFGGILTQETYTYNERSQLTGYTGPAGSIGYAYDPAGNLSGAKSGTANGYDVSYDYDAQNRISDVYRGQQGVDPNAAHITAYSYDFNGNLFGIGYANGIQHAYNYNTVNRLTDLTVNRISGGNTVALQGYGYTLDKNGMRTKITELAGRIVDHSYDSLMRLQSETITGGQAGDLTGSLSYTYDAVSNRTSRAASGAIAGLIPSQNHSFTVNDRLTSDTYDANGNTTASQAKVTPTQQSGVTDVYSFDNRLIRRTRADGVEIDLIYTPDGNRSFKWLKQGGLTLRQHHYLVDSNNPTGYAQVVEEHDPLATAGETLRKVHLYGHDLIASETHNGSAGVVDSHYYSYDGLGSVRAITDDQGLTEETYDYDAYGNLIGFAKYNPVTDALEVQDLIDPAFNYGSLTSEYLFTGEQWDADLGMYFLRARYLNTATGRFHSMDSYEGRNGEPLTLHKYLYAHGNPVMNIDPSGNFSLSEASAVQGQLTNQKRSDLSSARASQEAFKARIYDVYTIFGPTIFVVIPHNYIAVRNKVTRSIDRFDVGPTSVKKALLKPLTAGGGFVSKRTVESFGVGIRKKIARFSVMQYFLWEKAVLLYPESSSYKLLPSVGESWINCISWTVKAAAYAKVVEKMKV